MINRAAWDRGSPKNFNETSVVYPDQDPFSVVAQSYETLFFVRVRGSGQKASRVKLGYCYSVEDLFEKLGDSVQIPAESMKHVSICLPADVGELQSLDIKAGEQEAFELLMKMISRGLVDVGATVPGRYMLPTVVVPFATD